MKRSIHLLLTALLLVTFSQYSFTQAIHVETEGNGTISKDSGQQNLNGAMVWSGTEWVVNNTWAHTFFVNVETGTRLKNYESPWTCTGTAPTGVVLDFQQYQVTRNIYTYSKPASDNTGAFAYQAVEYLIHNLVSGHNIILRSRGSGNGITQASFDAYIEDDTNPPQTTLFRSDPVWFTFSGTAADAVNQSNENLIKTGDLPSIAAPPTSMKSHGYYLDNSGGSDMGGTSYQLITGTLSDRTNNLNSSYTVQFNLKWLDGLGNLQMISFFPAIVSETFVPADISGTFVISNEAPGYLIDRLIEAGYGNSSLYEVIVALQPTSGGVITDEFLTTLASCPGGSEIFTAHLTNYTGLNNPLGINFDGTILITPLFGKDYFGKEGFSTHQEIQTGVGGEWFTYAGSSQFFIDTGWSIDYDPYIGKNYQAFAIAWSNSTTPKAITVTANSGQSKVFGAADPVFAYTVSPSLDSGDSFTGALSREPGEDPGNYAITLGSLSAGANYTITFVSADFIITPAAATPTTFVLSNEAPGYLIDNLIAAGYGNSSLYEVMVALKPTSGGVISDSFLNTLAACPAGSEIFTAGLVNFAGLNNPVCINTDGFLSINGIFGRDYFGKEGYATYPEGGRELFTYATGPEYYIDAGTGSSGGGTIINYKAFAIAWSNSTDGIPDAATSPGAPYAYPNPFIDGFYVKDLKGTARIEVYDILGQVLYKTVTEGNGFIYLNKLPDGVYWLKLLAGNRVTQQKMVKHR